MNVFFYSVPLSWRRCLNGEAKLEWTHGFNRAYTAAVFDGLSQNPPINLQFACRYFLVAVAVCGWRGLVIVHE